MTDLPAAAITAAANALRRESEHGAAQYDPFDPDAGLRRILEAAAPHITAAATAAERERIVRFLEAEAPRYALGATALRRIAADLLEDTP